MLKTLAVDKKDPDAVGARTDGDTRKQKARLIGAPEKEPRGGTPWTRITFIWYCIQHGANFFLSVDFKQTPETPGMTQAKRML